MDETEQIMDYEQADALNSAIRALTLRHRARAAELLGAVGLHPGQEFLVMELADRGPRIQSHLASAIGCEAPSVTVMVKKLERMGHIRRRPSDVDGRAVMVELTESGGRLADELRGIWVTLATETLGTETPGADSSSLAATLTTMAENLRRGGRSR